MTLFTDSGLSYMNDEKWLSLGFPQMMEKLVHCHFHFS